VAAELYDYEGRVFAIYDASRGYVWQEGAWHAVSPELAGKVWAAGVDATGKAKSYGAKMSALPADEK
jgi:hypothetical protein